MTDCPICHRPPADPARPATLGPGQSCACGIDPAATPTAGAHCQVEWLHLDGDAAWPRGMDVAEAIYDLTWGAKPPRIGTLAALRRAADTYLHILCHPAGTEAVIRQVRQARRLNNQIPEDDNG